MSSGDPLSAWKHVSVTYLLYELDDADAFSLMEGDRAAHTVELSRQP